MVIGYNLKGNITSLSDYKVGLSIKRNSKRLRDFVEGMTLKEKLLNAKGMIMVHQPTNTSIAHFNFIHSQHFFPLSILDYAVAIQNLVCRNIPSLPILSIDSHDYGPCDFRCLDCLAEETRTWGEKKLGFKNFDPVHYEAVLTEISRYSRERGCESVRFEMSGEGNPDMYSHRARIIRHAKEKCNMGVVYVSSGSRLTKESIDALVECASYIRISFPGLNNDAYSIYSRQAGNRKDQFTYDAALRLLETLTNRRAQCGRDGELLIGIRTCMRPENEGWYNKTALRIGELGADSFQIVKILVPIGYNVQDFPLSNETIYELQEVKRKKGDGKLMHVQVPQKLDYMYYSREIDELIKPAECFSSSVSPILYGPHLVICTHWGKITDIENSHYGVITGEPGQLNNIIAGNRANKIRDHVPSRCNDCCSIYDNLIMSAIKAQLSLAKDPNEVGFYLTYYPK